MKRLIRNDKTDAYLTEDSSVKNAFILIGKQLGVYGISMLLILGCYTLTHAKGHHPASTGTDATDESLPIDQQTPSHQVAPTATHTDQEDTSERIRPDDGATT
jgi:hypothetical protein